MSILTTLLVVLTIILLVFFLYPRTPTVTVNSVSPASGAGGSSPVAVTPKGFTSSWLLAVQVTNPNYFGVSVDKITANAFHPKYDNGQTALGNGTYGQIKFVKQVKTGFEGVVLGVLQSQSQPVFSVANNKRLIPNDSLIQFRKRSIVSIPAVPHFGVLCCCKW